MCWCCRARLAVAPWMKGVVLFAVERLVELPPRTFPFCSYLDLASYHSNVCLQVWTSCMDGRWAGVSAAKASTTVFRTQPIGASLSDPALAPFRAAWCEQCSTRVILHRVSTYTRTARLIMALRSAAT